MADIQRNEVQIELAGETRVMRASFSAIRNIERELGNVLTLIEKLTSGDVGVEQCARIIAAGLRGYGDTRMDLQQVGDAVMDEGLGAVMTPVIVFVTKAMEGVKTGKPEKADEV